MASAPPLHPSTKETSNYAQLCRLLVGVGSHVLREIFDRVCPPENLHTVLTNPTNHAKLQTLRKKRVLSTFQWGKLYPVVKSSISSRNFDSSLLLLLLTNIFGLTLPASSWNNLPPGSDTSLEAGIARIKVFRDRVFSHAANASVDDPTFSWYWNSIKDTFLHIEGTCYEEVIDDPTLHCMDADLEDHYRELLREWLKDDDFVTDKLHEDKIVKKARKGGDMEDSFDISEQNSWERETVIMPGENTSTHTGNSSPLELSVKLPELSDLPKICNPWETVELPVDILLLTVEDCEFLSCFAYLKKPFKSYHISTGHVYFGCMGDDQGKKMKIALMRCSKGPDVPGGSLSVSKDAIVLLRPKAIFSVGACSGLNSKKVKLGDVVVSAKLITAAHKTTPSRDIGNLIKHVADGWKAPLQNADEYNAKVHCDGVVLSISEANRDMIRKHPEAIAVEMEGGGVYAAAHDFKTEWVVVKGIKDFADEMQSSSKKWKQIACVMAASVVANILNDPVIFQDWPHFNAACTWNIKKDLNQLRCEVGNIVKRLDTMMAQQQEIKDRDKVTNDFDWMRTEVGNLRDTLDTLMARQHEAQDQEKMTNDIDQMRSEIGNIQDKLSSLMMARQEETQHQDGFDPTGIIDNIRQLYKNREGWLAPFPWCEDFHFSFDDIYTRLKVIYRKKTKGTATDRVVTMSEIFNQHEECKEPRVVLIEGKPGMGKTTYCKKVVFDWASGKHATGNCFANIVIVLLIKCRDVQSGLWEAIEDQLLPREVGEDQRERFFDFIRHNQSNVLLVLDGLDEVSEKKLPMFSEIIKGRVLPNCRVVATARHEAAVEVRKYCDTLLEVEGFTEKDVETFIRKYFKAEPNLAKQLTAHLYIDRKLYEILTNPLNTALLCLVYEDLKGIFPESRTKLYMEIVECILRRYRTKQQLPENGEDLVDLYESQLKHLGSIALKGLLEDNLDFDKKELGKHEASDLPGFGFLSVQPGGSKLRPTRRYSFLHKTFQEFFAAFYLRCQLIQKEISTNSIAAGKKYRHQLKEVLLFTFGMLAARCEETVVNLLKSIATQLNQEEEKDVSVILECVNECKKKNKNVDEKLATALGASLQTETVKVSSVKVDETLAVFLSNFLKTNTTVTNLTLYKSLQGGVAALAECLKYNKSLTTLDLSYNEIDDDGAAALGECLKYNKSLTTLHLSDNEIGNDGAAALGECLKSNKSLTTLDLSFNKIGDNGAAALVECLKDNKSLTTLYFSDNKIGDDGAAALGECLKYNKSLTTLYLSFNKIGDDSAAALGEDLKYKKSLTTLDLSHNEIGDDGAAAALGECLKYNKSLTTLDLGHNEIGDDGAAALGECLKNKKSLTTLDLSGNVTGDDGAAALGECLKYYKSLTTLDLSDNEIGNDGAAALGECLKSNKSLTTLDLSYNKIGDDGAAAALGECLKYNKSLTTLDLSYNEIGDDGAAAALGEYLKYKKSLTTLDLSHNKIGNDGAAALGECLKSNKSLTTLDFSFNKIGDNGAAALVECLKDNKSLTTLYFRDNKIGDDGAAALGECLKYKKSLTTLDLSHNKIGNDGAAALGECLKSNKSLTTLYFSDNKIGDDGAAALGECLKYKKSLTTLHLSHNKIGNDGAAALGECLKSNKSLTTLDLSFNKIGDNGAAALVECLKDNKSLTTLDLSYNETGDDSAAALGVT
ncbi:NLR family CARD domain-containing protein 3-like isoform X3 [Pocillopora verrucosa]|uniref:NLR family CARD domain-containing protein 3-like isoform X3 n=1 Tax=Pocillopora verrucosa TaxID=203993 RepID=UPI00333E85F2